MMLETVPDLEAIHPMDAMQADEEILLLEQSFYSPHLGWRNAWL